jgi:hypothetical protein
VNRETFCECLSGGGKPFDRDDLVHFFNSQQYYPNDKTLKQKYFEESNWQDFKKDMSKFYQKLNSNNSKD